MNDLKKIKGPSLLSLLLVIWGLFMVCSGRVPDVNYDDDIFAEEEPVDGETADGSNSELMNQLAVLDDESTQLEDHQRAEILDALGISPDEVQGGNGQGEGEFLNEELFLDLETEIAELEKLAKTKSQIADSLTHEVEEADYQLAAINNIVGQEAAPQLASTNVSAPVGPSSFGNSGDYDELYQQALDDVYGGRHTQAIGKFRQLLKMNDPNHLADNCQYWIAESYYALGDFETSIVEFERVFAFDDNNKTDDAQFMIGIAYIKLGDQNLAHLELNNLLSFYQDSEYISRAQREFSGLNI